MIYFLGVIPLYTTKDLKRISDNHKYDFQKNTVEYKNAVKESSAKTFSQKLQYRLDNLNQKNKYSSITKSNIAWLLTELFVIYIASGESEFGKILPPYQTLIATIIVICLSAFNALRSAKIYNLGVFKKSNMFFIITHTIIFLASLSFCFQIY